MADTASHARCILDRIADPSQRASLLEAAWRPIVGRAIELDFRNLAHEVTLREAKAVLARLELLHPRSTAGVADVVSHTRTMAEIEEVRAAHNISQHALRDAAAELRRAQIMLNQFTHGQAPSGGTAVR